MEHSVVPLQKLIHNIGEDGAKAVLSTFSCPLNPDIETFLHDKAIPSNKQRFSVTHLVFEDDESALIPLGFFALANKILSGVTEIFPAKLWRRVKRFAMLADDMYQLPSVLIAQLGKNFTDGLDKRISGEELLRLALNEVLRAQMIIGGKTTYLECEDAPKLRAFYEANGFAYIGERETDEHGQPLLQYIRRVE